VPMSSGSSDDCFLQKGPGHSLSPPRHDQKEDATNHISVACFFQPNLSVCAADRSHTVRHVSWVGLLTPTKPKLADSKST